MTKLQCLHLLHFLFQPSNVKRVTSTNRVAHHTRKHATTVAHHVQASPSSVSKGASVQTVLSEIGTGNVSHRKHVNVIETELPTHPGHELRCRKLMTVGRNGKEFC